MQLCVPKTSFHGTDIILTCLCLSLYLCYWSPCCSSSSQSKGIGAFLFFHNLSIVRRYLMSSLNNCNTHTYPKSPLTDSSLPKVILKQLPQLDGLLLLLQFSLMVCPTRTAFTDGVWVTLIWPLHSETLQTFHSISVCKTHCKNISNNQFQFVK